MKEVKVCRGKVGTKTNKNGCYRVELHIQGSICKHKITKVRGKIGSIKDMPRNLAFIKRAANERKNA